MSAKKKQNDNINVLHTNSINIGSVKNDHSNITIIFGCKIIMMS